jgi:hypothetical protein
MIRALVNNLFTNLKKKSLSKTHTCPLSELVLSVNDRTAIEILPSFFRALNMTQKSFYKCR